MDAIDSAHERNVKALGVRPGDCVVRSGPHGIDWHVVRATLPGSPLLRIYRYDNVLRKVWTEVIPLRTVWAVHFQTDPWDHGEIGSVETEHGRYFRYEVDTPDSLPEQFRYTGTYRLRFSHWVYRGRIVTPRKPKDLGAHVRSLGLSPEELEAVSWRRFVLLWRMLQNKQVNGWSVGVRTAVNTTFKRTVRLWPPGELTTQGRTFAKWDSQLCRGVAPGGCGRVE